MLCGLDAFTPDARYFANLATLKQAAFHQSPCGSRIAHCIIRLVACTTGRRMQLCPACNPPVVA
uniref:Uncharacterized protein n=1 Tax=mine drainage metagenome TaxID=410659 RepID=E6PQE7_9ZZZZ